MPNWEYALIACEHNGGNWKSRYLNGEEIRDWKKADMYQFANQLGAEGWELISYLGTATGTLGFAGVDVLRLAFK